MITTRYTYIISGELEDQNGIVIYKNDIKTRSNISILKALLAMADRTNTNYSDYKRCYIKSLNVFKEVILPNGHYKDHKNDLHFTFRALGIVGASNTYTLTFTQS
jgi:hypothetical protein